jgi:hypothetical protein
VNAFDAKRAEQPQQSFELSTEDNSENGWMAQTLGGTCVAMGKTPEDAVARLWLALQKS